METDEEETYSGEEYAYDEDAEYNDEGAEYGMEDGDEEGGNEDEDGEEVSSLDRGWSSAGKKAKSALVVPVDGYFITEYSAVVPLLDSLVGEVSSLLDVDHDVAHFLLQHCRWNKERLLDKFFSAPEPLLEEAGLSLYRGDILPSLRAALATTHISRPLDASSDDATTSAGEDTFVCRICCDPCHSSTAFSMGCNHNFCRPCYTNYLTAQIADGPSCILAHCPQHKCKQTVTRGIIQQLVSTEDFEKYSMYVTRNFIEMSKTMRYCPAPSCNKVAVGSGVSTVRCSCSCPFCFRCGEEAHDPCSCAQLEEWQQKCENESETANWILANTKKCPNCNARIEKNQGCNHMSCKLCKSEFCWICMGE